MGVWSNEVDVTVSQPGLSVVSASLSADKTAVNVGGTVNFTVTSTLNREPTSYELQYYGLYVEVYVNGQEAKSFTQGLVGGTTQIANFSLQFNEPGTYAVKVYVEVGPGR